MVIDEGVKKSLDSLIDSIKATKDYIDYDSLRKTIKDNPELVGKIERAKEIRKQLSLLGEYDRNGELGDRLSDEFEEITEDTKVNNYIKAELRICTILQEMLKQVVETVDVNLGE